jgi:hypothetical protein
MTTTTERDRGVLSRQIRIGTHDGATVVHWSQQGASGLTVLGMQRALEATAAYLGGLDDTGRGLVAGCAGGPQVRIGAHVWEIPAAGGTVAIADLMEAVLVQDGSVGMLPS